MGRPIAFASTGEKLKDFDLFHPDRLAGRILGMGDMLTLIEKAEEVYEKDEAEAAAAKLLEGKFTLDDFLVQMQQVKKMGSLKDTLKLLPGMPKEMRDAEIDGKEIDHIEAIIRSMTLEERARPELIDASRRVRIATGSGTTPGAGRRAHQAVQGDEQDDEPDGRVRLQAHRQEEPQERQEEQRKGGRRRTA